MPGSVRNENIYPTQPLSRFSDPHLESSALSHINTLSESLHTFACERLDRLADLIQAASTDRHIGPFVCKQFCNSTTDAARSSRYQRFFPL